MVYLNDYIYLPPVEEESGVEQPSRGEPSMLKALQNCVGVIPMSSAASVGLLYVFPTSDEQ